MTERKPLTKFLQIAAILLVLGVGVTVWFVLGDADIFPIRDIRVVTSYQHINPSELQQIIAPYTKKSFFALDVTELEGRLLEIPWIAKVAITRVWPNRVTITITEQQPIAVWNADSLLNSQGAIFTPRDKKTFVSGLPQLFGPDNFQQEILTRYLKMRLLLHAAGLKITELSVNMRHGWRLQLANGIVLSLGNKFIMKRLQRFLKAYPKIVGANHTQIIAVDLRYNSGFAVKWKK